MQLSALLSGRLWQDAMHLRLFEIEICCPLILLLPGGWRSTGRKCNLQEKSTGLEPNLQGYCVFKTHRKKIFF